MSTFTGARIKAVEADSIAAELEIEPGDSLLGINGMPLTDYIDFLYLSSEEELALEILKKSGEQVTIEFEKDSAEPLGLVFEAAVFDQTRICSNHCLFCFVHQLPPHQRASLYIKDDDYRLSFLHGCYITLTNLTEEDWQRIERLRLSPLYVSVHATHPEIRRRLLGSQAGGAIIEQLQRLANAGITIHTQAVICPGINDGAVLEQTIADLAELWPQVSSLAVVPVGLTGHRKGLAGLRVNTAEEANRVIELVTRWQRHLLAKYDTRFVFAADEWYLAAGRELAPDEEYEGYPQLDNGVGLIRWFLSEFYQFCEDYQTQLARLQTRITVVTGQSAVRMWREIRAYFAIHAPGVQLEILPVENRFFGITVTVTGLLTGADIITAIQQDSNPEDSLYLIPQITLKQGETLFLDGVDLAQVEAAVKPKRIATVPGGAGEWLEWILDEGSVM